MRKTNAKKTKAKRGVARKPAKPAQKSRTVRTKKPPARTAARTQAAAQPTRKSTVWPGLPPGYLDRAR